MRPLIRLLIVLGSATAFAADPALQIAEGEGKRAAIEKPAPAYPAMARQLRITGKVAVEAIVAESGKVEEVRVLTGNPVLTKPVTEAVKNWRFKPFQAEGRPARAAVALSFEFGSR